MKKLIASKISIEAFLVLIIAFLWNNTSYLVPRLLAKNWYHYDMTTFIDELIPFLPWTVSIYFGCYIFWVVNYCICALQDESKRNRLFCADFMSKGICFLLFVLLPTTNIRPEITDTNIWGFLMDFLYNVDPADNLFPSLHCLVSWLCWAGIRSNKSIPKAYRYLSLIIAIAICISTITTRQHVIADVISGVLIAELTYFIAGYNKVSNVYGAAIQKVKSLIIKKQKSHW